MRGAARSLQAQSLEARAQWELRRYSTGAWLWLSLSLNTLPSCASYTRDRISAAAARPRSPSAARSSPASAASHAARTPRARCSPLPWRSPLASGARRAARARAASGGAAWRATRDTEPRASHLQAKTAAESATLDAHPGQKKAARPRWLGLSPLGLSEPPRLGAPRGGTGGRTRALPAPKRAFGRGVGGGAFQGCPEG